MISKILVPTDGSKAAQKAAKYAIDLAKQLKASVIVLGVIDKHSLTTMLQTMPASGTVRHVMEPVEDYLREAAEIHAAEIKKLCEKNRIHSKIVIATGHPVEEIIKVAAKVKVGFIVMGSHGVATLGNTILGSTTYGVLHNRESKVPVMVVSS